MNDMAVDAVRLENGGNDMRKAKILVLMFCCVMCLAGCEKKKEMPIAGEGGNAEHGIVYLFNFKSEIRDQWVEVANQFTKETGIDMKVTTQSNNNYQEEIDELNAGRDVPTLISSNGLSEDWDKIAVNLENTNFYKNLSDDAFSIRYDGKVVAVSYTVEGYGLIYNKKIMEQYFALSSRQKEINSMDDIISQSSFERLVTDMDSHKDELGIKGVFATTTLMPGELWRWTTHLMNLPLYYEYEDKNTDKLEQFDFTYNSQFRQMFDLFLKYSISGLSQMKTATTDDAMKEFAMGKCAFVQNGCWAWSTIETTKDKVVDNEDIAMLPLFFDAGDRQTKGLCVGTETYWYLNSLADKNDQAATLVFLDWLFTSESGKQIASQKLGFIPPMSTFTDEDMPSNPLATEVLKYTQSSESVPWVFNYQMENDFKDGFGSQLVLYAEGKTAWEDVVRWASENWSVYNNVK